MNKGTCDLCGLPLRLGTVEAKISNQTKQFCCFGCRQVYEMLMAATDQGDPDSFRETDIYQRCMAAGIIPASMEDLEEHRRSDPRQNKEASDVEADNDSTDEPETSIHHLFLDLKVAGMWCPACAWAIEAALKHEHGINRVACRFAADRLKLEYDPVLTSPQRIRDIIQKLGYRTLEPGDPQMKKERQKEFIRLFITVFLTMNVMMFSFALYAGFFKQFSRDALGYITWPMVMMAMVVFFYGGAPIHRKTFSGIAALSTGMETLITLGTSSAFFYSLFNWFAGSIHLYFDTASMLITLVLVGKAIENRTKAKVNAHMDRFFELQPSKARICTDKSPRGEYVNIQALARGDVFWVEAGETVPADGKIIAGGGWVDESVLTGEARPVQKKTGEPVSDGTTLVSGSLRAKALSVGSESIAGQLIAVMEAALDRKTGLENVTDRLLRFFVPTVALLALGTAAGCLITGINGGDAVIRAVTVLVVSCPCALGVAIPLARVAGIALAGKQGVLVHRFSSFEKISKIDTYVFDKTGTITTGAWTLLGVIPLDDRPVEEILGLAAGLEQDAVHAVGTAIVRAARNKKVPFLKMNGVRESTNGISGHYGKMSIKIGSAGFLARGFESVDPLARKPAMSSEQPVSTVYMAINGKLSAMFQFGDAIRPSSRETIRVLKERGKKLTLVSGDGREVSRAVGHLVGITDCHGRMRPDEKSELVTSLIQQGHSVAMVGDGINDVPALASADIGIAVHCGHRIGMEASGITLMGNDIAQILAFEPLAQNVTRTIRWNLVFTFAYNCIGIPVAMAGLLNPLVAVTAMLLSSLSVIGNTLLLQRRMSKTKYRLS